MGVWSSAIDAPHSPRVCDRAEYARIAVAAHTRACGRDEDPDLEDTQGEDDSVIHLLCDLMHLSMTLGTDFAALLSSAGHHFIEERLLEEGPSSAPATRR